jgi:hypothetical protein
MYRNHKQTTKAFLIWIAANLLGFISMSVLLIALPILKSIPASVGQQIIIVVPFGLAQWLVLRRLISLSPIWVLTFPVGLFLSSLIPASIPESLWQIIGSESPVTLTVIYIIMGAVMGLPQWLILRRTLSKAALWILASSLGVGLGFGLVLVTGLINQSEYISYVVVVIVYSIATGIILSWLLNQKGQTYNQRDSMFELGDINPTVEHKSPSW